MFKKIILSSVIFSFAGLFFFMETIPAQAAKTSFSVLVPTAVMREPLTEEKDLDSCFVNLINSNGNCSWDTLARLAVMAFMRVEFDGMTNLAQTGFFGEQSWIDNPDSYYSSINTEVTDYFFQNDYNNADLLPSIKGDVRSIIIKDETTPFTQKISEGVDFPGGEAGYQAFLNDWNACPAGSGWVCFRALHSSPKNDIFSVLTRTNEEKEKRQYEALLHTKDEVLAGNGYRDVKEDCTYGHYIGCESVTPGATLKDQMNDYLSTSLRDQLGQSDELDETVIAVSALYKTTVGWLGNGSLREL
jgi:hypothetical protein